MRNNEIFKLLREGKDQGQDFEDIEKSLKTYRTKFIDANDFACDQIRKRERNNKAAAAEAAAKAKAQA